MNRLLAFVSMLLLFSLSGLSAFQQPEPIARINDTPILADEFLYAFQKNRNPDAHVNKDSLLAYLERFINFKLKVMEARAQGIDTLMSFRQEYESYAGQVTKPYLNNPNKEEDLIKEAYERSKKEVRASHILIRLPKGAIPADTLRAYRQIDSLRKQAENGVDFGLLARKNSHDGSAQKGGDLGWFTAFSMIYPFETAAYTTQVGTVSPVIKTQFGYHILKVTGQRPARGKVKTSHIFIARSKHSPQEGQALINQVHDSLQHGGNWNQLCQAFSEDARSKTQNGSLPLAGIGQLPEEYLEHAFTLTEPGAYNSPVETPYGWHIIRLDERQKVPALEEVAREYAERVKRSGRLQYGAEEVLKALKRQNNFQANGSGINTLIGELKANQGQPDSLQDLENKLLFRVGDKSIYTNDFIADLKKRPAPGPNGDYLSVYGKFEEKVIFEYEDSLALIKYPEYRLLLQEYEEGLLLFEIMEDEVWDKALQDSTGLKAYYQKHKDNYPAPERAVTYTISKRSANGAGLLKTVQQMLNKKPGIGEPDSLLKSQLPPTDYSLLKIVKRTLTKDDLPIFASQKLTENQLVLDESQGLLYLVQSIIPAGVYSLDEIKGRVTADYQDYLDQEWIKKLRNQHKIKIYKKRIAALLPLE
jgi:peptidyl-prolyl cis-trans isomerase SurA